MSSWAMASLDELVSGTILQTTRVHGERLLDKCRIAEAYRLFATDRKPIQTKGETKPINLTDSIVRYRHLVADAVSEQLRNELQAVVLRTQYMAQLKKTLRTVEWATSN